MVVEIEGGSAAECYKEGLYKLALTGLPEETRNGKVLTITQPVVLTLRNPLDRVLLDPTRDANPFFHVMEWVWMLAGSNKVKWLSTFNSNIVKYSNLGRIHGAYGNRWLRGVNQIEAAAAKLIRSKATRQAVISMWVPSMDNMGGYGDYPCNTHIYFRVIDGKLNMTVCNRSNDFIWGMLGSNIVHFTYLHELIGAMVGIPLGLYRVFTNNLHIYEQHWPLLDTAPGVDTYRPLFSTVPLLTKDETYQDLAYDCRWLVADNDQDFTTEWMNTVAFPMYTAYILKGKREHYIEEIADENWRLACLEWHQRRQTPDK